MNPKSLFTLSVRVLIDIRINAQKLLSIIGIG